jgi:hypothetical protein
MEILTSLFAIFFIGVILVRCIIHPTNRQRVEFRLSIVKNFKPNRKVTNKKGRYLFAADDSTEKFVYITPNSTHIFSYKDIISVEVIEDGEVVIKKSISRTIGGAIIGGVIAGRAGTIVGGLSGGNKQKFKVSSIIVKILLRNHQGTSLKIPCLEGILNTHDDIKDAKNEANLLNDILIIIIDKIDRNELSNSYQEPNKASNYSLADELMKLNEMKEKGVLTEYEFFVQKERILRQ